MAENVNNVKNVMMPIIRPLFDKESESYHKDVEIHGGDYNVFLDRGKYAFVESNQGFLKTWEFVTNFVKDYEFHMKKRKEEIYFSGCYKDKAIHPTH